MESNKKRERQPNFTDEEVRCLLECIGQEKDTIQCKLQDGRTARSKNEAWGRVTKAVNACKGGTVRSQDGVRRKWKDLKSAVMKEQINHKTKGGGESMKAIPFKDVILCIIGDKSDSMSGIEVTGADSPSASSIPQTPLENVLDEDSSCSLIASTDSLSNSLCNGKRHLRLSSLVSTATVSEASDADPQPSEKTPSYTLRSTRKTSAIASSKHPSVPGMSRSIADTISKLSPRKRKTRSNTTKDDIHLFNTWLSSEIDVNSAKKELIRSKIEKNAVQKELIELLKQKTSIEIQFLNVKSETETVVFDQVL